MASIPIGLQLYSVRHALAEDLHGVLAAVARMGYAGVEFFGPPQHAAGELRAALEDVGLVCCGWHVPFALLQDDALPNTVAFHQALGNHRLIAPGIPAELRRSRDDWLKLAGFFNRLAARLADEGMVTGYHNHHHEFTPMDGETPWDAFFSHTDQAVIMQLDTGNARVAGADVVGLIRKYPGRAVTVHLKPYDAAAGKDDPHAGFRPLIGADDTDWDGFFQACETVGGTEWYIVEYESDAYPPLEAVDRCLQALRAMGK
ncbi:MAG: sugar phosphate isomerase/epimerase [Caldilineae bacterium]|nr:MAG: sugar phosphate isomerase/epimerase [Caldilineae bacterium]